MTCCTSKDKGSLPIGKGKGIGFHSKKADTIYTQQAAMNIYAYQPERALQIIDSAVIVGNITQWQIPFPGYNDHANLLTYAIR